MQVQTFLPCFPGFYETNFEFDNEDMELEYINDKRAEMGLKPIGFDDVEWNYKNYHIEVSKKAVRHIEFVLNEMNMHCKLEFVELKSPREYNFSTDTIVIEASFDPDELREMWGQCKKRETMDYLRENFMPSSGFIPFTETLKKANPFYWMETNFDNFQDAGWAMQMILLFHPDSEFDMDEFVEKSTHEVEVGIDNYNDLIKVSVDIDKWNAKMGYSKYPETQKFFDTDPDVPESELPYRQGDVVYMEEEKNYGVVIGHIDADRGELRTDLAGMVAFSDIRIADCNDAGEMQKTIYGREILSFLKND